jgi:hypothetical protein
LPHSTFDACEACPRTIGGNFLESFDQLEGPRDSCQGIEECKSVFECHQFQIVGRDYRQVLDRVSSVGCELCRRLKKMEKKFVEKFVKNIALKIHLVESFVQAAAMSQ